jgi:ferredoxin
MNPLVSQIRETARRLLREGRVDLVLGYETGPVGLRNAPCFVRDAVEVERLTWDRFCGLNLAVFLNSNPRRIAIFAKGCDSRAIVNMLKERQIVRENLVIVGVPCQGMIDRARIERLVEGREVEALGIEDENVVAGAGSKRFVAPVEEMLRDACRECVAPTPAYYDLLLDGIAARQPAAVKAIQELPQSNRAERWRRFEAEAAKCIRCYACRNVCPLCYCRECCADQSAPRWIATSPNPSDNAMFLLMRALHLAGRCVDCGACVEACPVGVDVRYLFKRLEREVRERFGYISGADPNQKPPLATFATADPEDFITDVQHR